jgi:type 2 lantibiotic biosynthesis protein LanM
MSDNHPTHPFDSTQRWLSPRWWQALTLSERATGQPTAVDAELAARRMQRWREATASLDEAAFAAHLQADGLTPERLQDLLGEPAAALQQRMPEKAPWLADLAGAYQERARQPEPAPADFLALVQPLMHWAHEQLHLRLDVTMPKTLPHLFSAETAAQALQEALSLQLPPLLERTLVLEMHVARLQGLLAGATPAERFASFIERLQDQSVAITLLEEYPVLARQLVNKAKQTTNAIAEILERLARDWGEVQQHFSPDTAPGDLLKLAIGAGDTHRNGRSVAILHFASGLRLVYKPRSLAVDRHFQELLQWLNERGADPAFRTLTVLDRGDYGWVEFVTPAACAQAEQVERFYTRQGGYLALLHALRAADFHFENLIAAGEHPMLIDLEALFHPDTVAYDPGDPGQLAQSVLDQSVLSIGMLPQRLRFHAGAPTIDISGIGAADRQLTPDKLPTWEGVGTDEMRLTRRHVEFSSHGHRPALADGQLDVRSYGGAVARGFAQIYRLLLAHRDELLAAQGPLARFAHDEVRVVARATRTYALMLQESSHPDLLRNALDRDRLYSRLWNDVATVPSLARLVAAERRDLHNGDVPIFLTQPGVRHLWDSTGQRIAEYLPESGLTQVERRLRALNEEDLARQLWYIGASFATLDHTNHHAAPALEQGESAQTTGTAVADPTATDAFLLAARAIGDRLAQLAQQHQNYAVWIGLGLDDQESWSLAPLTMHLYDGHAGIALFLAYLGQLTAEPRYTQLAERALATTLVQAEGITDAFSYVGGFTGWGGLIYLLAHLGKLWQRPDLWQKATALAETARSHVANDQHLDIIGGAAGCIGATAALYECTGDQQLIALIEQCASHLLAQAQPQPSGIGWITPNMGGRALAGFSHGAAGIAWALSKAAALTGNASFDAVARKALDYERSLFDEQAGNWLDLRSEPGEEPGPDAASAMYAWCHGAPGIGLARLSMLERTGDSALREEATLALRSTATHGFGGGHSLCHGDLGNLEIFVKAAELFEGSQHLAQARQLAGAALATANQTGWRCGVPGGIETPGLMVGLAGIGYELLRVAHPASVPSVLLLESPR